MYRGVDKKEGKNRYVCYKHGLRKGACARNISVCRIICIYIFGIMMEKNCSYLMNCFGNNFLISARV